MSEYTPPPGKPFYRHQDPRWNCRRCENGGYSIARPSTGMVRCNRCGHEIEPPVTDFSIYTSVRHAPTEVEVGNKDWDKLNKKILKVQKHLAAISAILADVESYNNSEIDLPS